MDLKDPKNQILILLVIIFGALIYVWYAMFYTPNEEKLIQRKAEYQKLSADLFAVKQKAESLDGLKREVDVQKAKYEKVKLWLPEQKEDEAFLHQIHMAEQSTNSTIMNITPLPSVPMEFYTANSYQIEIESSYHGLGHFFERVVNFPFIVTISDVLLESREEKSAGGGDLGERKRRDLTVSATFKLTTYNTHPSDLGGQTQ
jgi:Tfp pilus assembly protein PilO